MRPPLSQVVVLVSHLQRPRQRSRLASLVAGLAAGYPDVHIEVLEGLCRDKAKIRTFVLQDIELKGNLLSS